MNKLSGIKTSRKLADVIKEFDSLLDNLSKVIKEVRPRTNVLNTKLGMLKKDLLNIESLDSESVAKVSELVSKYNAINNLFTRNIEYNKVDLVKIIEGKSDYSEDGNDNYNDHFFELSMGIRLSQAIKDERIRIDLNGACDVIINDLIAIECKYIHSPANIIKNISKAKNQIKKRVEDGQAKTGFIALDLSNIVPRNKVNEFSKITFNRFVENYESLEKKGRLTEGVLESILADKNFYKIISSYIMSEAETALYCKVPFDYDLGDTSLAIIFQTINSFSFEYKDKVMPLSTRGMTYFMNPSLSESQWNKTREFIHSLAVGV